MAQGRASREHAPKLWGPGAPFCPRSQGLLGVGVTPRGSAQHQAQADTELPLIPASITFTPPAQRAPSGTCPQAGP